MKILIRVDSSQLIGSGHLFRCLCVGTYLQELGHTIVFITRTGEDSGESFLISKGHRVIGFEFSGETSEDDARQMLEAVGDESFDGVLVDHYELGEDWENLVGEKIPFVFVIDDLGRRHQCNYLLDPTLGRSDDTYRDSKVSEKVLVGSRYAVLREEFLANREKAFSRRRNLKYLQKILINFGGGDVGRLPIEVLKTISKNKNTQHLSQQVLVSNQSEHYAELKELCLSLPSCELLSFSENMADLIFEADLAIGAAGVTAYERASLGLPSILVQVADNQSDNINSFSNKGLALTVDRGVGKGFSKNLNRSIDQIFNNFEAYKEMIDENFRWVSPLGLIHELGAIFGGRLLEIREAEAKDIETVFNWQSFPGARQYSRNKTAPTLKEHTQWFRSSLKSMRRHMFILQAGRTPVGFLRLDESERSEVSVLVSHAFYGNGLAKEGLSRLREKFPHLDLYAYVQGDNEASVRVFTQSGYHFVDEGWYLNQKKTMPAF